MSDIFLNSMKREGNKTRTENGALSYKGTLNNVLDLFSKIGDTRGWEESRVRDLVKRSYLEDKDLTIKAIFYARDIRLGQGERQLFRIAIEEIANIDPDTVKELLMLIPEYGRWDDILSLLSTSLENDIYKIIKYQLNKDIASLYEHKEFADVSLLAKWLPSENAGKSSRRLARKIIKGIGTTHKKYRKALTMLRKHIGIVESKLTEGKVNEINYSSVPSLAHRLYQETFIKKDYDRYNEYLDNVSEGTETINASVLYPYQVVQDAKRYSRRFGNYSERDNETGRKLANLQWDNLPDFIDEYENSIVMADTSGSMSGTPMDVSVSLAIYMAERNKGVYHNHFMTFTDYPRLVEIGFGDLVDKIDYVMDSRYVGYSTDISKALEFLLQSAINAGLSDDDLVKKLYIISDMQFDSYVIDGTSVDVFDSYRKKYEENGYTFPKIVFWNVNASTSPVEFDKTGTMLVSGLSPSILKYVVNSKAETPIDLMLEVLNSERYENIKAYS